MHGTCFKNIIVSNGSDGNCDERKMNRLLQYKLLPYVVDGNISWQRKWSHVIGINCILWDWALKSVGWILLARDRKTLSSSYRRKIFHKMRVISWLNCQGKLSMGVFVLLVFIYLFRVFRYVFCFIIFCRLQGGHPNFCGENSLNLLRWRKDAGIW